MLLKVFSQLLDENHFPILPQSILDAGSGVGVLGICAAGALLDVCGKFSSPIEEEGSTGKRPNKVSRAGVNAMSRTAKQFGLALTGPAAINYQGRFPVRLHAQDRDELARVFTEHNARRNGLDEDTLCAHTEPLLGCGGSFDLILCNVPAKAGLPVLEDFVRRSANCLNPGGRVLMVSVNTLADFFEKQIKQEASLNRAVKGPGHTVFLFGSQDANHQSETNSASFEAGALIKWNPSYLRNSAVFEIEKTPYRLDTIHGAEGFDRAGGEAVAAAKLAVRLEKEIRFRLQKTPHILIWEGDQGHFPAWFVQRFGEGKAPGFGAGECGFNFVLAGRNILALDAARRSLATVPEDSIAAVSAVDMYLDRECILPTVAKLHSAGNGFSFIAAFPKTVPQTSRISAFWDGLNCLSLPGALILIGLPSGEAESFDRLKPRGFTRIGDIRRKGFRALAYGSC